MHVLLFDIHIVKEFSVEPVVAALDGVAAVWVIFINGEHLDIGEGDLAFLELLCQVAVEGHRCGSCGQTEFERTRKSRPFVVFDGFDNNVCHLVASDVRVIGNLGGDLLVGMENALRQVLLNQSTVLW